MSADTDRAAVLEAIPLFAGLAPELRATLAEVAVIEDRADGEVLFREGDTGDRWYVVVHGAIEIGRTVHDEDGSERTILFTTLAAGDSFGEVSVFDAKPRSADAVARGETRLVALERPALQQLLADRPAEVARLLVSVIGTLSSTVRRATQDLVTVYETGKTAGSVREPDALAERVLALVHDAVGADRSAIGIWDPYVEDYGWTEHGAPAPDGGGPAEALSGELGELVQQAFESGEPTAIEGAGGDWLGASAIIVPVWSESEGLGILVCASDRPGAIGLDQGRLAGIVALQVGGAIAIARHEQEARDRERLARAREGFGELL